MEIKNIESAIFMDSALEQYDCIALVGQPE